MSSTRANPGPGVPSAKCRDLAVDQYGRWQHSTCAWGQTGLAAGFQVGRFFVKTFHSRQESVEVLGAAALRLCRFPFPAAACSPQADAGGRCRGLHSPVYAAPSPSQGQPGTPVTWQV